MKTTPIPTSVQLEALAITIANRIDEVRAFMKLMDADCRLMVIQSVAEGYCRHCGADTATSPCYCTRDE